jgi:hypothetical protein
MQARSSLTRRLHFRVKNARHTDVSFLPRFIAPLLS